jgi:hypothetical protein
MKVFILNGCYDYEGEYILGVYSSRKDAESARDVFKTRDVSFDGYEIVERELNAPAEYVA